jgi:epidermal growth factor receptor kinase substrate 8
LGRADGKNAKIALVVFSRKRENSKELIVSKGEYIQVMEDTKMWWRCRNAAGETGYAPHTLLFTLM